ncbi:unnamed protein product [Sympodiomycopsis kandeliae]
MQFAHTIDASIKNLITFIWHQAWRAGSNKQSWKDASHTSGHYWTLLINQVKETPEWVRDTFSKIRSFAFVTMSGDSEDEEDPDSGFLHPR